MQTAEEKGSKSVILFLKSGITRSAKKEIEEQMMYGKYVIVITKKDLENTKLNTPFDLLMKKIDEADKIQEQQYEELI